LPSAIKLDPREAAAGSFGTVRILIRLLPGPLTTKRRPFIPLFFLLATERRCTASASSV
jgi:hypothetical protein